MVLIIVLLLFLSVVPAYSIGILPGEIAPGFSLNTVDGKIVSLSDYKDKIVILLYWRAGQERSLLALTDVNEIFESLKDKDVQVLGLTAQTDNPESIRKILRDNKINYPVLLDSDRSVYGDYGIFVYPTTIIINRSGQLAYAIPSHALTYRTGLEARLRYILGEIDEKEMHEMFSPHKRQIDKMLLAAHRKYNLAMRFAETGFIDQAIKAVSESIEASPDNAKTHILSGFLFLKRKKTDKAIEDFNQAIKLDPHSHDAKTGLGAALILKGDIDGAIKILTSAAVANPYSQMTYYDLGIAYEMKGDLAQAVKMYRKALEGIINKAVLPSAVSRCAKEEGDTPINK